ncbi:MAG: YabP/YqfC family sporulation protein [Christensenellaceae bacterium]
MAEQIIIENKKTMQLNSVKEVKSYTDLKVKLVLNDGVALIVCGKNLKINNFSKQTQNLLIEGEIASLQYRSQQDNLLKKMLK